MEAVQTVEHPTFESVWAGLQEVRQILKDNAEHQKEIDRIVEKIAEKQKKSERRQRKENEADFNTRLGENIDFFGEVSEYEIAPKLREKFLEFGFVFLETSRNVSVNDRVNNISFGIDVILENYDKAMLVDVKTNLTVEWINNHIERLEEMRKHANLHSYKQTFLGAVAGVVVTDNVKKYALKQGFFVIEPSGETFNIIPPIGKPKEW